MSVMIRTAMRRLKGFMFRLPSMIDCAEFEAFILAYLEDDLPRRQKRIFEMHLKLWRECRDYLKAYRISVELAARAAKDDTGFVAEDVPEDLVAAVIEARKA